MRGNIKKAQMIYPNRLPTNETTTHTRQLFSSSINSCEHAPRQRFCRNRNANSYISHMMFILGCDCRFSMFSVSSHYTCCWCPSNPWFIDIDIPLFRISKEITNAWLCFVESWATLHILASSLPRNSNHHKWDERSSPFIIFRRKTLHTLIIVLIWMDSGASHNLPGKKKTEKKNTGFNRPKKDRN